MNIMCSFFIRIKLMWFGRHVLTEMVIILINYEALTCIDGHLESSWPNPIKLLAYYRLLLHFEHSRAVWGVPFLFRMKG